MGCLASLTLKDEVRQGLGLPHVVYECEDVFSDELSRLPPHRDVDFVIELHPGTSPFMWLLIEWHQLSCRISRSNCRNCWTRVLLDRALYHVALRFCFLRRRIRLFDYALIIDS